MGAVLIEIEMVDRKCYDDRPLVWNAGQIHH